MQGCCFFWPGNALNISSQPSRILSQIPSDLEQLKVWLPCFNSGHQPPLMHPMLPMPLSLFRGLHNLSNLAKAIYINLYPFISIYHPILCSFWYHWIEGYKSPWIQFATESRRQFKPDGFSDPQQIWRTSNNQDAVCHPLLSTVTFAEERLQCAEHTIAVTPWGLH